MLKSAIVLSLCLCLAGCSGDWSYELPNNYEIVRVNSSCISLCQKKFVNGKKVGWRIVIDNYYVTAFCVADDYILTAGVKTEEQSMAEQKCGELIYYMVNSNTNEISRPFAVEEDMMGNLNAILGKLPEIKWIYTMTEDGSES